MKPVRGLGRDAAGSGGPPSTRVFVLLWVSGLLRSGSVPELGPSDYRVQPDPNIFPPLRARRSPGRVQDIHFGFLLRISGERDAGTVKQFYMPWDAHGAAAGSTSAYRPSTS